MKKITDKRDVIDRLSRIIEVVRKFGFVLTLVFSIVTVIVMFNTIRLTIYNRREEIEIMRLVGASNSFIRGPFIIEGMMYGLAGSLMTAALLYPVMFFLTPRISGFLEYDISQLHYFGLNFWALFGSQVVFGIALGIVSSLIVIRRYLKI